MSLSRRHLLASGLVLGGTGVLAACSSQASGPLTIGLTYTPNIQFAPFYMAKKDSKYASGVNLRHHGAQEGLFDALLSGKEQLVVAGADEAVVAASNGSDLVVVGGYYQSYPACLIVPEGSAIKAPADLKGKTVGTPGRKGETWYALQLAMDTASLSESDLTIQDIGYTQQAALVGGKVDAVVGFSNNDAIQIRQAGTPVRTIQGEKRVIDGEPLKAFSVVVGSFVNETNARGMMNTLRNRGYAARVMKTNETINGHTGWYRVVASSFSSKSQAVQSKNSLRDTYPGAWILGN